MTINVKDLGTLQLDGLREVANIGAGHAATALSQLTRRRIMVDVPRTQILPLEKVAGMIGSPDEVVGAVLMQVLGDITGRTVQIYPAQTAARLAGILLGRDPVAFPAEFAEMEQSALKEASNILGSAYLNALSDFLGLILLPSVPSLAMDLAAAVLTTSYLEFGEDAEYVFCLDTHFRMDEREEGLQGHFLLLPDASSLQVILRAIRLG